MGSVAVRAGLDDKSTIFSADFLVWRVIYESLLLVLLV